MYYKLLLNKKCHFCQFTSDRDLMVLVDIKKAGSDGYCISLNRGMMDHTCRRLRLIIIINIMALRETVPLQTYVTELDCR